MHEVRQIIQRLRLREKNRKVARAQRVGRNTAANIRRIAGERGWLDAGSPMPDAAAIAEHCKAGGKNLQNISTVEVFREEVLAWHAQGIQASTMRHALARKLTRVRLPTLQKKGAWRPAILSALSRGVPHPHAVRLALETQREARDLPPPVELSLPAHVAARDTRVQPHSLDSYDQLTKPGEDDV